MSDSCFQLKGSVVTTFILELYQYSLGDFTQQLKDKIKEAPSFFEQSPIIISLEHMDQSISELNLDELLSICRQCGFQPMAFKCTDERFLNNIKQTGLALLSKNASRATAKDPSTPIYSSTTTVTKETIVQRKSKVISLPIRSGQQVYAKDTDLIILSHVSEGAEVLADGHIHVYGTLRGRAIAGANGDDAARIFCRKMEAELISIAGNFMLNDTLREKAWQQPAQAYLDEQILHVEAV